LQLKIFLINHRQKEEMNGNGGENIEEPLFEPHYEFRGQENYAPTHSFLKKMYLVLDVQIAILLAFHLLLGTISIPATNVYIKILVELIRSIFPLFLILMIVLQMSLASKLKSSAIKTLLLFALRSLVIYALTRGYFFAGDFNQTTLMTSLMLSLYLAFTAYIFSMGATYKRGIAFIWLLSWMMVAVGFMYLLKEVLIPGIFSHLAILLNVFFAFLYGLYLIYETGFLIEGEIYHINHNQYLFGALVLQVDLLGLAFWAVKKCTKNPRRN